MQRSSNSEFLNKFEIKRETHPDDEQDSCKILEGLRQDAYAIIDFTLSDKWQHTVDNVCIAGGETCF